MINPVAFKRAVAQVVLLPLALTIVLAGILSYEITRVIEESNRINQRATIISKAHETEKFFLERESLTRHQLLLYDTILPSDQLNRTIDTNFQQLHSLVQKNSKQLALLDSIIKQYWDWDANLHYTMRSLINTKESIVERSIFSDRIKLYFATFIKNEEAALKRENGFYHQGTRYIIYTAIALSIIVGLITSISSKRKIQKLTSQYENAIEDAERNFDLLKTTLLSIEDGIIVANNIGRITLMNPVAERLTGWRLSEAKGRPAQEVFKAVRLSQTSTLSDPIDTVITTRKGLKLPEDSYLLSRRSSHIPIESTVGPIWDDEHSLVGIIVVFRDITDHKISEAELYKRQEEFRALIDNSPDPIVRYDTDLHILYANPSSEQLLGLPPNETIGKTYKELGISPEAFAIWEVQLRNVIESKEGTTVELEYPTTSGKRRYQVRLVPEADQEGVIQSILASSRDITELRRREQQIRENEERFRTVIESSLDAYYILHAVRDKDHEIVNFIFSYCNEQGVILAGRPREEMMGHLLTEIWGTMYDEFFNKYKQVIVSGTPLEEELQVNNTPVRAKWIYHQLVPLGDQLVIRTTDITRRRELEEYLYRREEEFRALVEKTPDAILRYDKELIIRYVNPTVSKLMHATAEQLVGKHFRDLGFERDVSQPWENSLKEVFATKAPTTHTAKLLLPGGEERHFEARNVPEFDQEGNVEMVVSTSRDITNIISAEQQLLAQERLFRKVADASLEALYLLVPVYDKKGAIEDFRFQYVNQAGIELLTIPKEQLIGNTVLQAVPSSQAIPYIKKLAVVLGDGTPASEEFMIRTNYLKSARWLYSQYLPIGNMIAVITSDITERKTIEEALKESERRYRELIENASEAIFSTDINGTLTYANPYIKELTGYSNEDLPTLNYVQLIIPEYRERAKRQFFRQFLARIRSITNEYPFYAKDGSIRWIYVTTTLRFSEDTPIGFDCIGIDITNMKALESVFSTRNGNEETATQFASLISEIQSSLENISRASERIESESETTQAKDARNIKVNSKILIDSLNEFIKERSSKKE